MSAYEPEIEEALKRYAELDRIDPYSSKILSLVGIDVDRVFEGITTVDGQDKQIAPSDYWDENGITLPADVDYLRIYTKRGIPNPWLRVRRLQLPDMTGFTDASVYWGTEVAPATSPGSYFSYNAAEELRMEVYSVIGGRWDGVLSKPADYKTAENPYSVRECHWGSIFNCGDSYPPEVRGFTVLGQGDARRYEIRNIAGPDPYRVAVASGQPMGARNRLFVELYSADEKELSLSFSKDDFVFGSGQPFPAKTWDLFDSGADTLMTSGTYDSGTSHKSASIPVAGYDSKAFLFRADTDSVADGLAVEVYTTAGNWRTYLTRTYSANELESIEPTGEFPLMRLAYEPSADGASITDAEATVR